MGTRDACKRSAPRLRVSLLVYYKTGSPHLNLPALWGIWIELVRQTRNLTPDISHTWGISFRSYSASQCKELWLRTPQFFSNKIGLNLGASVLILFPVQMLPCLITAEDQVTRPLQPICSKMPLYITQH